MEDVGIIHIWTFGLMTAIGYILWSFGIIVPFWYVIPRKIWQPCSFPVMEMHEKFMYIHYFSRMCR
jgi:hypothetical protein